MAHMKLNKMLECMGGNHITLERITRDERTPAEKRLTAFLAINKKSLRYADNSEIENANVKIESKW
jgi:hypothetical protein